MFLRTELFSYLFLSGAPPKRKSGSYVIYHILCKRPKVVTYLLGLVLGGTCSGLTRESSSGLGYLCKYM